MPSVHAYKNSAVNLSHYDRIFSPRVAVPSSLLLGSPTVAVVVHRTVGGRLGHALLDIQASMAVAALYNWSWVPPGSDHHRDVWHMFDFRHLAPQLLLSEHPRSIGTWYMGGCCPPGWRHVHLRQTHWVGVASWHEIDREVRKQVPLSLDASARVCVHVALSWRVMLHHVKAWETQGHARPGVYNAVIRALRSSLLPPPRKSTTNLTDDASLHRLVPATVAVHARRNDLVRRAENATWRAASDAINGRSTAVVAGTVEHLATALAPAAPQSRSAPCTVDAVVFTETRQTQLPPPSSVPSVSAAVEDTNDVWTFGCPKSVAVTHCRIASGSLHEDFWAMVTAQIFVPALSSLSFVAAYLRLADNKPSLVTVGRPHLTPTQFWMFWGPDDDALPPLVRFLNASTDDETARAIQDPGQIVATREWLRKLSHPCFSSDAGIEKRE